MTEMQHGDKLSRRGFLKSAAALGGAAGTAAVAASVPAQAEPEPEPRAGDRAAPKGYRETQHIRDYYARARF